jgi:hypothetical protein
MMYSLYAAASITAIIQITFSIASVLEGYYEAVKDARHDIQRLYQSVDSLRLTIHEVKGLRIDYESSEMFSGLLAIDTDEFVL